MEVDIIRTSGDDTIVGLWIVDRIRTVAVPRRVITAYLGLSPAAAAEMSDHDCREFVRTHLTPVADAAARIVRDGDPQAKIVSIGAGLLAGRYREAA